MLSTLLTALIILIAVEHVGFMMLEMFFWRKPLGLRTFGITQEVADASATLAANQGLYNGFLAAGLFWGVLAPANFPAYAVQVFFLSCVLVAGIYGGVTAARSILVVQALPALIALALLAVVR